MIMRIGRSDSPYVCSSCTHGHGGGGVGGHGGGGVIDKQKLTHSFHFRKTHFSSISDFISLSNLG